MKISDYVIRGGVEGRERLRILSRVMQHTTDACLVRAGIKEKMACLEIGCGGGDVAFDMARMVGPLGRVVGTDIDETALELGRHEASGLQLNNVEFRVADITQSTFASEFDLVHARFVLTHLADPARALANMRGALRPGGVILVEDIDFRGHFAYPESAALTRYVELYSEIVRRKGADPNIGPRLPSLLTDAGFENVQMHLVQLAGMVGEVKLMTPITMQSIGPAVIAGGLASEAEVAGLVAELFEYAQTPGTIGCIPRVIQAWGYQPSREQ
jgi:ubiquinone/menaquinone biosynthesis C-methylase UbiE